MKNIILTVSILISLSLYAQVHDIDTVIFIKKNKFEIKSKTDKNKFMLLSIFCKSKLVNTIKVDNSGLCKIIFTDFDKDGFNDIMFNYYARHDINDLYLFDYKNNKFKEIVGFVNFSTSIQLKSNHKYYYSYESHGCADYDWISDLYSIENFKIAWLARINGLGCENSKSKIVISKVAKNDKNKLILLKEIPYSKNIPKFGYKWDFIELYWNKNYKNFTKQPLN